MYETTAFVGTCKILKDLYMSHDFGNSSPENIKRDAKNLPESLTSQSRNDAETDTTFACIFLSIRFDLFC